MERKKEGVYPALLSKVLDRRFSLLRCETALDAVSTANPVVRSCDARL